MSNIEIRHRNVGPWGMNTYALVCPETNESVLVDPGDDPETLLEMLGDSTPQAIWLTHTHVDHVGALAEMRQRLGVPVMAHGGPYVGIDPSADKLLADGEQVTVGNCAAGNCAATVIHAPGHAPEQICFVLADHRAIVGDTIFAGGPGKTWSAAQFQQTLVTLREVVLPWPDDAVCYPGHGPSFRLGDIRKDVETFLTKNHGDFYGDAEW